MSKETTNYHYECYLNQYNILYHLQHRPKQINRPNLTMFQGHFTLPDSNMINLYWPYTTIIAEKLYLTLQKQSNQMTLVQKFTYSIRFGLKFFIDCIRHLIITTCNNNVATVCMIINPAVGLIASLSGLNYSAATSLGAIIILISQSIGHTISAIFNKKEQEIKIIADNNLAFAGSALSNFHYHFKSKEKDNKLKKLVKLLANNLEYMDLILAHNKSIKAEISMIKDKLKATKAQHPQCSDLSYALLNTIDTYCNNKSPTPVADLNIDHLVKIVHSFLVQPIEKIEENEIKTQAELIYATCQIVHTNLKNLLEEQSI